MVSSIINGIQQSTPNLVKTNFAWDTNIANIQGFEPEYGRGGVRRQDCLIRIMQTTDHDEEDFGSSTANQNIPKYTVTNLPIYDNY